MSSAKISPLTETAEAAAIGQTSTEDCWKEEVAGMPEVSEDRDHFHRGQGLETSEAM